MQYTSAKRYPLIGVRTVIPVEDVPYINPITGFAPTLTLDIDLEDNMSMENLRGKYFVVVQNTDEVAALVVTIPVPVLIEGYAAIPPAITIPAESQSIIGPFSSNFEQEEGLIFFNFSGAAATGLIGVGRIA